MILGGGGRRVIRRPSSWYRRVEWKFCNVFYPILKGLSMLTLYTEGHCKIPLGLPFVQVPLSLKTFVLGLLVLAFRPVSIYYFCDRYLRS
jgi:hypothetical protein